MSTPDEIRAFAKQNGTREAITPAVLHLLQQGETPTGHAVYKLLGQGSQTTINNQIKVAYQELGGLIAPILATDVDSAATPNIPILFNAFLKLFDQAALAASATWNNEKTELTAARERADAVVRAMQIRLDQAHQANEGLTREIEGLKARLDQAGIEREQLAQALRDAQAQAQLLDGNITELTNRLTTQALTHDNALSNLTIQHETKLRELEALHANAISAAATESRNQLSAQTDIIERQQQALLDAELVCKDLKAELEKQQISTADLRLELALAKRDNEALREQFNQASESDATNAQMIKTLQAQNASLQSEINEQRTQMAALKASKESLDAVIERLAKPAPRRAPSKKKDD